MSRNRTTRERKVRGSRIRSSRDEKDEPTQQTSRDGDERSGSPAGPGLRGEVGHEEPFVETDAVREVRGRIERWLAADRPVHLVGPTGVGKTALAMQVARERDRPVVFINGDADLTTADLVGDFAESERESVHDKYIHNVVKTKEVVRDRWVDNPLTVAVREGATLVYNEFSRTKPVANNVLLSVFEEGVLELPGQRGENRYVDVHPEFRAVLTSNSVEYAGVHQPQDALLDRLVGIHMDFYDAETERAILCSHAPEGVADATVDAVVAVLGALREELDVTVGTRAGIMAVEGLAVSETVDEATVAAVFGDVLGSKAPDRESALAMREDIARVVAESGAVA